VIQIVLLVFVVGIWGKVIYDFFKYKELKNEPISNYVSQDMVPTITESFDYELDLDYRDPFLGKYSRAKSSANRPRSTYIPPPKKDKPDEKPKKKVNVKWPKIEYVGNILNTSSRTESVTLRVNGEESFMLPGQTIQGVTLKSLFLDSIQLVYQEEQKTILR